MNKKRIKMFEDFDENVEVIKGQKIVDNTGHEHPIEIEKSPEDIEISILSSPGSSFEIGSLLVDIPEDNKTYYVNSVNVSSKHRNKGLYVALIKKMLDIIKEDGIDELISPKNPPAGQTRSDLADGFWAALFKNQDKHKVKIQKKNQDYYIRKYEETN